MKNSIVTKELFYKKICCLENQVNDIPVLPTASVNDTLRYNGASWVASSFLTNDGSGVNIGSGIALYSLDSVGASDAWRLPNGPTGDRPSPASGIIRWNTDLQNFEFSDGAVWEELYRGLQYWVEGTDSAVAEIKYFQVNSPSSDVSVGLLTKGTGGVYIGNSLPPAIPTNGIAIGNGAVANKAYNIAIGSNVVSDPGAGSSNFSVAIGRSISADRSAIAIGYNLTGTNGGSILIGSSSSASVSGYAIGSLVTVGQRAVGIGYDINCTNNAIAIGQTNDTSNRQYSILIGANNTAQEGKVTAIGRDNIGGYGAVMLGDYNDPDGYTVSYSPGNPPSSSASKVQTGLATILSREITGTTPAVLGKNEDVSGVNAGSFIQMRANSSISGTVDVVIRVITPGASGLADGETYSYHYTFAAKLLAGTPTIYSTLIAENGDASLSTGSFGFYTAGPSPGYVSFEYTPPTTADVNTVLYVAAVVRKIEVIE